MILAIDTAGPWVAVAAGADGAAVASRRTAARLNHNEVLAGLVQETMAEAGIGRPKAVAVNTGPGSFTGTRVGVSFAVGLAQGWDIPVAPFSSFEVAARLAPDVSREVSVAFPVVGAEWCLARLIREGTIWVEQTLEELNRDSVEHDAAMGVVVVPWGESDRGVRPPDGWNPAVALLALARATGRQSPAAEVQVRYVGLSQAERNFHARKQSR